MRTWWSRSLKVAYMSVGLSLLFIGPANAYIDPGSGSIIFQAVVGGAMALGLGIKIFWQRIAALFSRKR